MYFYDAAMTDPAFNLATEEYIFKNAKKGAEYLFLWQNSPSVIIGKFQNAEEEVNLRYAKEKGIAVVRRLSGGGAVYHDLGNLNYTVIADRKASEGLSFKEFTKPLVSALKALGIDAESGGRNDITFRGKKISGSSEYIRGGKLLHHGCVLLSTDTAVLSEVLHNENGKIESKSTKSHKSRVSSASEILGRPVSAKEFKKVFISEVKLFRGGEAFEPLILGSEVMGEIEKIRNKRYASWDWNFGKNPKYSAEKTRRFSFGTVTAKFSSEDGRIAGLSFSGDFFGSDEIKRAEELLKGVPLREESLKEALKPLNIGQYIFGMTEEDLIKLLCE